MKLSVKSDYAARALLSLARKHHLGRPTKVEELAGEHGIPPNYLVQILIELKAAGLVRSQRGKQGGYLLAKPPKDISMADVLRTVHGEVFESPAAQDPRCPLELREAWLAISQSVEETAENITLQKILDDYEKRSGMYYI